MDSKSGIKLCPHCKTGYAIYMYDDKSPICPYLGGHNGQACGYFVEMDVSCEEENDEWNSRLKKI